MPRCQCMAMCWPMLLAEFKRLMSGEVNPAKKAVAVTDCLAQFLETKSSKGFSPLYIRSLRQYLTAFATRHNSKPLDELTSSDIEQWFESRGESGSTRASNLGRLSSFFAFAVRRGYIQRNPCDCIERDRITVKPVSILDGAKVIKALRWTSRREPRYLAFIVLALLCGLRPHEAMQTSWSNIDMVNRVVRVEAQTSKNRRRRIVELQEGCHTWLSIALAKGSMLPITHISRRRFMRKLREALGFEKWPQDIMRHTCATYRLAWSQNPAATALTLGHSQSTLLRNYNGVVSKSDASRLVADIRRAARIEARNIGVMELAEQLSPHR